MQVSQTSAPLIDGSWTLVTPMISNTVAFTAGTAPATQRGQHARLVVTFVKESSMHSADVSGFEVSDIELQATAVDVNGETRMLPTLVELVAKRPSTYEFIVQPNMSGWPSQMLAVCTEVTLTIRIPGTCSSERIGTNTMNLAHSTVMKRCVHKLVQSR